mmetsp:Transcript_667/g.1236  ORF Transcript_667/g.1236 Transcript_667/m.1236 type:complete len:87 (+) Transcript_667:396-656(+)
MKIAFRFVLEAFGKGAPESKYQERSPNRNRRGLEGGIDWNNQRENREGRATETEIRYCPRPLFLCTLSIFSNGDLKQIPEIAVVFL